MTAAAKPDALLRLPLEASSFPELIAALSGVVDGLLGWRIRIGVFLFDEQREVGTLMPGSFGVLETPVSFPYASTEGAMQSRRVLASRTPFFSNDVLTDERMANSRDALAGWGVSRVLILPLEAAGDRIGVLLVGSGDRPFTDADVRAIAPSIPDITAAIEVAEALFVVRRRQRLEAVLGSVAVAIASAQDLSEFLFSSLDELCVAIDATLGTFVLADAAPIVWRAPGIGAAMASDLLARVQADDEVREELLPWSPPGDEGGHSGLQAPVWLGTELVGTFAIFRTYGEMFSSDDRQLLLRFAKLTALAWATERYQQQRAELARTEERARIADDLHDDVAQMLFAAQMSLDSVLYDHPELDPPVRDAITRGRALVGMSDQALRHVIAQLASPATEDLCADLRGVVAETEQEFGAAIRLEISPEAAVVVSGLRRPVCDLLVKATRELVVNAAKHAGPCRVIVRLRVRRGRRLLLTVVDDGIGLRRRSTSGGHGLEALRRALRRHGGAMRISAGPAGGLEVTLGIDLLGAAAGADAPRGVERNARRRPQVREATAGG